MEMESWSEVAARHYRDAVERTVERLRRMADEVERAALNVDARTFGLNGGGPHTYAASQAVNAVAWGLANAHLDALVKAAGTADGANSPEPADG